jgi:hypothetical protein
MTVPIALERGKVPWAQNAFYFQVLEASLRIARADASVERWVDYFRKKRDDVVQGDRWTDQHPPRARPSGASSTA